ncbi:MAG: metalloregulator ArsR/SmtB family transcription factor [Sphingomicrobium sp.]
MSATISSADTARRFAALGDPHRLALVGRLAARGERSISQLGVEATISRQALTKHLRVLESAGLVRATRFGREVRFRLERQAIAEAERFLNVVALQWDDALTRLKDHVER